MDDNRTDPKPAPAPDAPYQSISVWYDPAIDAHFRADARRGVRYLLWHVQRVARRPETKLDLVPPEVERWARERVRSVLEAKAARKTRSKE